MNFIFFRILRGRNHYRAFFLISFLSTSFFVLELGEGVCSRSLSSILSDVLLPSSLHFVPKILKRFFGLNGEEDIELSGKLASNPPPFGCSMRSAKYLFLKCCSGRFSPGMGSRLEAIRLALVAELLSMVGGGEIRSWSLGIDDAAKCLDPEDIDEVGERSGGPGYRW